MKLIQVYLRVLVLFVGFVVSSVSLQAEGSWQMGLNPSVGHNQSLLDYYSQAQSDDAGLERVERPLYVDILTAGEYINVHACGSRDTDPVRIEIFDKDGWNDPYNLDTF